MGGGGGNETSPWWYTMPWPHLYGADQRQVRERSPAVCGRQSQGSQFDCMGEIDRTQVFQRPQRLKALVSHPAAVAGIQLRQVRQLRQLGIINRVLIRWTRHTTCLPNAPLKSRLVATATLA